MKTLLGACGILERLPVDGALGSAGAGIGLFCGKQGRGIMPFGHRITGSQDPQDFRGHPAIGEKGYLILDCLPDQPAALDLIHAGEQDIAGLGAAFEAVLT